MTERIELPSGAWVELKDTKTITMRQRQPLIALFGKASGDGATQVLDQLTAEMGGVIIAAWSFEGQPSADAYMDCITQQDNDVLQPILFPMVEKLSPTYTPDGDANSPTGP